MSIHSIKKYQSEVEKIIQFGGTKKETAIRNAFYILLNDYAKQKGLMLIPELSIKGSKGKMVTPDGTMKDSLRLDWGYWESKDEADNIDEEIYKKFKKGYPKENILFEDSKIAILIQQGNEVMRVVMSDADALNNIILEFISYERPEVENFHKAIELFKQDIPNVTATLRSIILEQEQSNNKFKEAESKFWILCKESINSQISIDDIREMMIQHILTEDIFNTIFGETQFHRENNIACELEQVILTFFTGKTKHIALGTIQHYYLAINSAAAQIADHHEKQKFLKVIYEVFYKGYNPKAADRLGVVYTPNEIVKFMIESTDYLLYHHFSKGLEDKGVEILDPATGTGTFICDIIDYMRNDKLPYKYEHEIHANEIAILPYYIANLNIEYTYKQKTGEYKEFENLCFVDTLDNLGFGYAGKQGSLFGVSAENTQRIKRQNSKKISVIIGNPPYNANQMNENENNKNRVYPILDKRIKETFIKQSNAQKPKVYDMYARFYRWSMDRIGNNGVVCFISNNSFINARTFDGFRKCVQDDFQQVYIIDLGGNIRELSGKDGIFLNENHTIFGQAAAVGIAMMWLVKDSNNKSEKCQIKYIHPTDIRATREEKLAYLQDHSFKDISFENVHPDKNNNWIKTVENDWESLLPVLDKSNKLSDTIKNSNVLFRYFTNGIVTARDEWIYDLDQNNLLSKIHFFKSEYNKHLKEWNNEVNLKQYNNLKGEELLKISSEFIHSNKTKIKWSGRLFRDKLLKNREAEFNSNNIKKALVRPYSSYLLYYDYIPIDNCGQSNLFYHNKDSINNLILFNGANTKEWNCLSSSRIVDFNCLYGGAQCIGMYFYSEDGVRLDNITEWGLQQFHNHYNNLNIIKEDIFNYVYAVLHNPQYRIKYELNLKRDFPRIPFYTDFHKWAAYGKELMDLHINYETAKPFKLKEISFVDSEDLKPKLKANREASTIILDEATTLTGIPSEAWQYKIGNRSALEWILDQYKEKKPKDPTIREKFNNYKFSVYKDKVIDLIKRVCTVSIETVRIIKEMEQSTN